MARPREFDTDQALEAATQVFWQHGYQGASLPDLLQGMGLTRGSLYKAFKDKKTLFLLVLDRYELAQVDRGVAMLVNTDGQSGAQRIIALFEGAVATAQSGDTRGCLLCTAAAEAAAEDPDIAAAVHKALAKMQRGFAVALADAPALAGLNPKRRQTRANALLTQYIGLRMLVRSGLDLGVLDHSVAGVADMLAAPA